jgi:hypothetical protein
MQMKASESTWCRDYDPMYKLHGCELGRGHPGPHRDLTGYEWEETLPPEPWRCDEDWSDSAGRDAQCTLDAGHGGLHLDRSGNRWGAPELVREVLGAARTAAEAEAALDGMSMDDLVTAARGHGIAVSRRDGKEAVRRRIATTLKG